MDNDKILITSPNLEVSKNVSGVSAVTNFIIENNDKYLYIHFKLGKIDGEKRGIIWLFRNLRAWVLWFFLMIWKRNLIVHFNLALDRLALVRDVPLIYFAHLLKKRMIIHVHGGEFLESEEVPKWIKKLIELVCSWKEPKIVLSSLEKELIIRKYKAKNVFALPNSINIKDSQGFDRVFPPQQPLKLLFIGRIVLRKGLEDIFNALVTLNDKNLDFKFYLAGAGPEKDIYVNKFSELLGTRFEFKGIVSGLKKNELLKECDIFLLPSTFGEGLPIALLEAMSYAEVPIVTDVGSMKYVVRDGYNGFVVKIKSSVDIVNAVEKLSNDRTLLKNMGKNSQFLIFEDFNPNVYIKKLNEIYEHA